MIGGNKKQLTGFTVQKDAETEKWHVFLRTNRRSGYQYVIAETNHWDKEKKQARVTGRQIVGRIQPTNEITVSPRFRARFPQFTQPELFFWEGQLLSRSEYLSANPNAQQEWNELEAQQQKDEEEAVARAQQLASGEELEPDPLEEMRQARRYLRIGKPWAAWMTLLNCGMLNTLVGIFGADDGLLLAQLAVYVFDQGPAMDRFEDWAAATGLPRLQPVPGQRISELLRRIDQSKIDAFFKSRYDAARERFFARQQAQTSPGEDARAPQQPFLVAFDSTGISTYSTTIDQAEYGHARQNPELGQVNLMLLCDEETGEAVFAYHYWGSINDSKAFVPILQHMISAGFDLSFTTFVTDRGFRNPFATQFLLDHHIGFVQGIPIVEDSVKKLFRQHKDLLTQNGCMNGDTGFVEMALSPSEAEAWTENLPGMKPILRKVFIYLYYNPLTNSFAARRLARDVEDALKILNSGRKLDPRLAQRTANCIGEKEAGKGQKVFYRKAQVMTRKTEFEGCLAIRTDRYLSADQVFTIYSDRNNIERTFRELKVEEDARRLMATQTAFEGKLFVYELAQSIYRQVAMQARKKQAVLPGNSLNKLLAAIEPVVAVRVGNSREWRVDLLTRRQTQVYEQIGVTPPAGKHYFWC